MGGGVGVLQSFAARPANAVQLWEGVWFATDGVIYQATPGGTRAADIPVRLTPCSRASVNDHLREPQR